MTDDPTLLGRYDDAAEASAAVVISRYSTSFGAAARLLDEGSRRRIRSIYALVRVADEVVDGTAREAGLSDAELRTVLDDLETNHTGIKARVLDEEGKLRRFVNVYVGNDDVRFLDGLQSPTPEGTQISIIPAVAGG